MIKFAPFRFGECSKMLWKTLQVKNLTQPAGNICTSCYLSQIRNCSVFYEQKKSKHTFKSGTGNLQCLQKAQRNQFSSALFHKQLNFSTGFSQHRQMSGFTLQYFTSTEFLPVRLAYNYFITVHDWTGLPWWATVIFSTILLRSVMTLPLFVVSQRNIARYSNVNYEMIEDAKILRQEVHHYSREHNLSHDESKTLFGQQFSRLLDQKIIEHNCHPLRAFIVVMLQVPVWISMSLGLRNLCGFNYANLGNFHEGLIDGGVLWFTNLTVADPTFILPVCLGIFNLFITEVTWLTLIDKIPASNFRMTWVQNYLRFLSLLLVPIASMMPSIICLYWVSSSFYGVVQFLVMQQPKVRRAFNIPKTPTESENPIQDIVTNARKKYLKQENEKEN